MTEMKNLLQNKNSEKCINIEKIINKIADMSQCSQDTIVVGIDGRCGSGKTTLAAYLSSRFNCSVIHMDDFFLPLPLRTEARLKEAGGNVHYERFKAQVIDNLPNKNIDKIRYERFSCAKKSMDGEVVIPKTKIVIVEGTYSLHKNYVSVYDYKIFCYVDVEIQKQRIIHRNGESIYENFKNRWIPMEELYFSTMDIKNQCDILLNMD